MIVQVSTACEAEFVALPEIIVVTLPDATLAYDATEELFVAEDTSIVGELFEQVKDHFTDAAELATSLTRPYDGGSPNSANAFYTAVCGDRTLEKNYWFLDGSNPATITRIAVANDGKMTSHMQVNRADVETDADVFAFEGFCEERSSGRRRKNSQKQYFFRIHNFVCMAEKDTKCAPAFKHYFPRATTFP